MKIYEERDGYFTSSYLTAPCIDSLLRVAWLFHDSFLYMIPLGASASGDKRKIFSRKFPPIATSVWNLLKLTSPPQSLQMEKDTNCFLGSWILRHTMTEACF